MFFGGIIWFDKLFKMWGPGVHLHICNLILNSRETNDETERIIEKNKKNFFYGAVSPDITLGKKYIKEAEKHCHLWETGFKIVENAKNEKEYALGLGYIVHLAADVIAHNFFLPKQLLSGRGLRSFSHTLIEIKSDMMLYKETSDIFEYIISQDYSEEDEYLKELISPSYIPFGLNKRIFTYSLKSMKNKNLYNLSEFISGYTGWMEENREILKEYHALSYSAAIDVVNRGRDAEVTKYDPNGYHHFEALKELRKEYRALKIENYHENFYKVPDELKIRRETWLKEADKAQY